MFSGPTSILGRRVRSRPVHRVKRVFLVHRFPVFTFCWPGDMKASANVSVAIRRSDQACQTECYEKFRILNEIWIDSMHAVYDEHGTGHPYLVVEGEGERSGVHDTRQKFERDKSFSLIERLRLYFANDIADLKDIDKGYLGK